MARESGVDPDCIYACNPFHQCADYCIHTTTGRAEHRFRRAISGFLIHAGPRARLTRTKTDLNGDRIKEEEEEVMKEQESSVDHDASFLCDRCTENSSKRTTDVGRVIKGEESEGLPLEQVKALVTEKGERNIIAAVNEEEGEEPIKPSEPTPRVKPPRLRRAISGFLIHKTPRPKPRIERASSGSDSVTLLSVPCQGCAEYCSNGSTETKRVQGEATEESSSSSREGNRQVSGIIEQSQLPPLNPIRREGEGEDSPATSVAKQRAGWSIIKACMTRIREYLIEEDPIDHEAIEILLASMENSEKETGYSFENWRTAVRKVVADAKRLGSEMDIDQLKESIMVEREKALTEAQMSLNDERIRFSKTERALKDQMEDGRRIVADIDVLKRECSRLRKQLVIKERDLDARKKELKSSVREHASRQQGLASIRDAVSKKEEIVSEARAELELADVDAITERDRLRTIFSQSLSQILEFKIGHQHPDFS